MVKSIHVINCGVIRRKLLSHIRTEKNCRSEKNLGHRGYRKVKCELNQGLFMVYLYMYITFIVHSREGKEVIVLKLATKGRHAPHDDKKPLTDRGSLN